MKEYGPTENSPSNMPPVEALPEWQLLIGEDVDATPGAADIADPEVEAKRTKLSIDCAEAAFHGDATKFPRLDADEVTELCETTREIISTENGLEAFRYLLLTHDSGKSHQMRDAIGAGPEVDHDEVFAQLMNDPAYEAARHELLPSLDQLSPDNQQLLANVARLKSNYPQTLQGEAPASTLEDLHNESDPRVRDTDVLKAMFDIFGAAGHVNPEVSLTATSPTYRRMKNLNAALRDPSIETPEGRNDAFLDAEISHFMGDAEAQRATPEEVRALARLECHMRVEDQATFDQLRSSFDAQPPAIKELLTTELNRGSRATLAYYGPDLVRKVADRTDDAFALEYYAHVLQESHIADREARAAGLTGIATVQLEHIIRAMQHGEFDPQWHSLRFVPVGDALIAQPRALSLEHLDGMPEFNSGEQLRGKRLLVVGEGGGSDGIQAAMTGRLLAQKYGAELAAVGSIRGADRHVTRAGRHIGRATQEITADTAPVGSWRFLEKIPLEDDPITPMFLVASDNPEVVQHDVEALLRATGADAIVGVDTGGDSLYRSLHPSFSAHLPTDITPDHDYNSLQALDGVAAAHASMPVLSTIVAPGVDSPQYAREVLDEIGAQRVPLHPADVASIAETYARWRMDGTGSEEGRYGKTPFSFLHALRGNYGFQFLPLPTANLTSLTNPWRAFTTITPAMGNIVISDLRRHFDAVRRS